MRSVLARARASRQPVAVAVLDLDHFKRFNDTHGHPAGDRFLKAAVAAWQRQLRPHDVLARQGGEEFSVILDACPADAAYAAVERLRSATPMEQTCSAGVASWDFEESWETLLARADAALYAAKAGGRDMTVYAGSRASRAGRSWPAPEPRRPPATDDGDPAISALRRAPVCHVLLENDASWCSTAEPWISWCHERGRRTR